MNGKRAKAFRSQVYGDEYSPKFRKYGPSGKKAAKYSPHTKKMYEVPTGQIVADARRRAYQKLKQGWIRRGQCW